MNRKNNVKLDDIEIKVKIDDSITADKLWDSLPLESVGTLWGEEVFFRTDISASLDNNSKLVVELGDVGYWPPNKAMCIFYGKTPASTDHEIRPASAVNVFGKVVDDIEKLKKVKEDCDILVTKVVE